MRTEPPNTVEARIRVAIPAPLRAAGKLLDPETMGLPYTAYAGSKLANESRCGEEYGRSQLVKALAAFDCSDPGAARVVIVAGSDFTGTSEKLFWPETPVYWLPGPN